MTIRDWLAIPAIICAVAGFIAASHAFLPPVKADMMEVTHD